MRRAAGCTLRTAALGGWAVLALAVLPAAPGSALAAGGQGHGATDGPARPHGHVHVPHADGGGPRGEGHHVRGEDEQREGTESPAPSPAPPTTAPRIEIADALGPITGVRVPGEATDAAAGVGRASNVEPRTPLLSFDAPSPFAPRSLAGDLRDAPGAAAVHVSIRRGDPRHGCGWWTARRARFSSARRESCPRPRWIAATLRRIDDGRRLRWRVALGGSLPNGSYRFVVRVLDARGLPLAFRQ